MSLGALSNRLTELNLESENVSGCPEGQICSTKANCKVYPINRYGHRYISQGKASQGNFINVFSLFIITNLFLKSESLILLIIC
jgi:hypothetical protein